MTLALMGRKIGMTHIFSQNGEVMFPVTVILATPNTVSAVLNKENNGYDALQIAFEDCKEGNLSRAELGHLAKSGIGPKRFICEFRTTSSYLVGENINLGIFQEGDKVKVTGTSKGKGFTGVIKRYHQSRGPMAHGSGYHRGVGSMGSIAPNRVFKGKKLPGRAGNQQRTVLGLSVHKVICDKNLILIKGCVPGHNSGLVLISKEESVQSK